MDDLRVIYHMVLGLRGAMALVMGNGISFSIDHSLVEAHVHSTSHALPWRLCPIGLLQTACSISLWTLVPDQ